MFKLLVEGVTPNVFKTHPARDTPDTVGQELVKIIRAKVKVYT